MSPTISLILPVYNAEAYLPTALDSILAQTFRDFEVILVNDGSTDGSLDICRRYARQESRFLVIDTPNGGVSKSRNLALDRAQGTYLQFMDADDWLSPDAMEVLAHTAASTGADLVISHFYRVAGDRMAPRGHIRGERFLTRREFAEEMMKAPANFYYGEIGRASCRERV